MYKHKLPSSEELANSLRGRKGVRRTKPEGDGLVRYVWRHVLFHTGINPSLPMTAEFDLWDWCEENEVPFSPCGYNDPAQKKLIQEIDQLVDEVIELLGEDKYGAARRWAGLI